jgi:hypothetical protein
MFRTNWDDLYSNDVIRELKDIVDYLQHLTNDLGPDERLTKASIAINGYIEDFERSKVKRRFMVQLTMRPESVAVYGTPTIHEKYFDDASEAWKFYDDHLKDKKWQPKEPIVIRNV